MCAGFKTQNKHMDWADENEDWNYSPIAELNKTEMMKVTMLFGIMKLQFQKQFTDFDAMTLSHTLVSWVAQSLEFKL